jgi:uncharacterized protein YoxC
MVWLEYRLDKLEEKIMSLLSDFLLQQRTHNAAVKAAVAQLGTSVAGVTQDIQDFKAHVTELLERLANAEVITPEDKIAIAELGQEAATLVASVDGVSTALKMLDEQNPPAPPVVPVG